MKEVFLISDTHFGHENILKFTDKDGSVVEMEELMIQNWNKINRPQDHVYHLGDVYFDPKATSSNNHVCVPSSTRTTFLSTSKH